MAAEQAVWQWAQDLHQGKVAQLSRAPVGCTRQPRLQVPVQT